MVNATAFDRLMLILVGRQKAGKSRMAATARKPVFFMDHDKRWQSLAGLPGVFVLTFNDSMKPGIQPTSYNDQLTVLTDLESGMTLAKMGEKYGKKDWPDIRPKTLVMDSMTSLSKAIMDYNLYANPGLRREIVIANMKLFFPGGWDAWNADVSSAYNIVMRLVAMKDMDLILNFHESDEKGAGSTSENPVYTGKKDLFPDRYRVFNTYFSEIWRVSREQGQLVPTVQVSPDFRFTASSNLNFSKLKPTDIVPDISAMIAKVVGQQAIPPWPPFIKKEESVEK